jgi:iron complex outermembrane receptor protein
MLATAAAGAMAQDDPGRAGAIAPNGALLEEVIVTGRKREERLEEVPDSISVFGEAAIERSGIRDIRDVAQRVPNFSITYGQQPGAESISIRGVGQVRNGEPPVAVVIDGVQLASGFQMTQELFDIERIEVLKGPQGAVYGRNAIGGAINVVTRKPDNEFEGAVEGGFGTGDDRRASAHLSGALVDDRLMLRAAGSVRDFEGDIDNSTLRHPVNGEDTTNLRLNLLALPTDALTLDLRYSRLDTDAGAAWYAFVPPSESISNALTPYADRAGQSTRLLEDAVLKVDLALESSALTLISAYSTIEGSVDEDFDFTPLDLLSAAQVLDQKSWSHELRLASTGSGPVKWLAGAYYLATDRDLDTEAYLRPGASLILVPFLIEQPTVFSAARSSEDNTAYAAFGQLSRRYDSGLELSLAVRHDVEEREQLDRVSGERFRRRFSSFQPKAAATYFFDNDAMMYLSLGKGFRSGGFNANARITRIYQPETNWNLELGAKLTGAGGRLAFDAAAFFTRVDDRQIFTLDLASASQVIANPVKRAEIRGVEFNLMARPVDALELSLGAGYMDTKIRSYDPTVYADLPSGGDFTGNRLPLTPEFSYSAAVQYRLDVASGLRLNTRLEANGSGGEYYWEVDNRDERDSQMLVSARILAEIGSVTVVGSIENLFDEDYVLEYVSQRFSGSPFGNFSLAAPGRRYGLSIKYAF